MRVVFFHRQPIAHDFSIEILFEEIRKCFSAEIECVVATSRYPSRGVFPRLYNIIEAACKKGDVYHITGDVHYLTYLLRKKKTLLTIHDCGFLERPSRLKRYLYNWLWLIIPVKRASLISVVSQATKNELIKYVKCDPEKIYVIHDCVSSRFVPKEKMFNDRKPRILQVGTRKNKNLLRVIESLDGIPCHLDIVGHLTAEHQAALEKFHIEYSNSRNISTEAIVSKYQNCDLVTLVSTYEGFGMPIIEANAVGRPVITSNMGPMPEVAGDAACLVDPFDVSSIRAGIRSIISDQKYREQLVNNGYQNVLRFRPESIARAYVEVYTKIFMDSAEPDGRMLID